MNLTIVSALGLMATVTLLLGSLTGISTLGQVVYAQTPCPPVCQQLPDGDQLQSLIKNKVEEKLKNTLDHINSILGQLPGGLGCSPLDPRNCH